MIDKYTRYKERRPLLYYFNIFFWSLLFLVKPATGVTQNSIKSDKDIIVTYNAANALVDATVYKTGNRCYYYYAKVKHTSGLKTIQEPAPGEWKASYLFDASDDCKNQLAREDILKRDREGCDDLPTAIKTIKGAVGIEEPQKVVTIVNSVCLDALKELSYEEIIKLIKVIAKQPKLKEDSELAIIRLINAINSNKYGDFFRVLEENQNELIKYLVEEIDDASLCFWYDNNYTNFMGALVKMCQSQTTSYLNKIPEAGDEKLLGQVLNIYNQPFKNDLPATGIITGVVSMNEFTFCGIYDKDRGTIDIERKKLVINPAVTGSDVDNRPQPEVKGTIVATGLSPLTPIIYTAENELPLVATALDMPADTKAHQYIVPAIFLKYKRTKEFNDAAERSGMIVLDAVTIAASGSAALATKVNWVKRIWALMEVAGAIGDIGVNTSTITDPNFKAAVDIYNAAMGGIGLKNSAKGLIGFTNGLPDATKTLLAQGQPLKSTLSKGHTAWQSAVSKLTSITANERKILEKQMWGWRVSLHLLPDDAWFYNPNMSDRVRQIVANSGEGMGKFVNINYWASRGAASKEDITWLQNFVTKHFPAPKEGDVLRKVMPVSDFEKFHKDKINPLLPKAGFVTRANDYTIPESSKELIEYLRLDYSDTKFSSSEGFVVIEYKNLSLNVDHPFNTSAANEKLPYTNTGMTGTKSNIIPEYYCPGKVEFHPEDKLTVYSKEGEILTKYKCVDNNASTNKNRKWKWEKF